MVVPIHLNFCNRQHFRVEGLWGLHVEILRESVVEPLTPSGWQFVGFARGNTVVVVLRRLALISAGELVPTLRTSNKLRLEVCISEYRDNEWMSLLNDVFKRLALILAAPTCPNLKIARGLFFRFAHFYMLGINEYYCLLYNGIARKLHRFWRL